MSGTEPPVRAASRKFPSNPLEYLMKHGLGQPSSLRVIARAVIAVGQQQPICQPVEGAVTEGVSGALEAERVKDRLVGDGAEREDGLERREGGDLEAEERLAGADFLGRRLGRPPTQERLYLRHQKPNEKLIPPPW